MTQFVEDPSQVLDYTVDWSAWLAPSETITVSTWSAGSPVVVQGSPAPSINGGRVTVWLSGGVVGQSATVVNHITTSQGRQDSRSFDIWFGLR
jgi:hypothetical protein